MANLKFSQFTEQADPANVQFLVGYNGTDNVKIAPSNVADLSAYLPLAGGTMTGDLNINVVSGANNITSAGVFTLASHNTITDIYSYSNGKITTDINADSTEISTDIVIPSNKLLQFNNSNVKINTDGASRMYLKATNSFYFETSGYVGRWSTTGLGIGTTSPSSKLHVVQELASPTYPMVKFAATRTSSTFGATSVDIDCLDYGYGIKMNRTSSVGNNAISFWNTGSQVGSISIQTSSTVYSTTSDYRLKENISPILNGIDRIKQLKPKRFNFIGDTSIVDGFLAHEAQDVVPEAVTGEKDGVLPNGDPVYQGIDQGKLVPLLTAALQEAVAKIEFLETRIETLENA